MKKFFSFAIMAVTALTATVLTSCDKNDDGFGQSAKSSTLSSAQSSSVAAQQAHTMKNVEFVVCIEKNQDKFVNESYVLDVNGQTRTVDVSMMSEMSEEEGNKYLSANICKLLNDVDKNNKHVERKFLKISVGTFKNGTFSVKSMNKTIKADHPEANEIHFIRSLGFVAKADGQIMDNTVIQNGHLFKGVIFSELQDFLNVVCSGDPIVLNLK